ncbi:MAG TPA: hypothetical protein VGG21_05100 [Acidimicrobiales bacterium]|jgi:hypothetical protein
MAKAVSSELSTWAGWDLRTGARALDGAAHRFASNAPHFPSAEVRFELLAVAGRGFRPPRFLTSSSGAASEDEFDGLRSVWSVRYRQIAETKELTERPFAIYFLGVNAPEDASDDELEVFNDFYTNVHLVEVAERRRALRAVRYELVDQIKPPYQGAPRYLAVYEVDEKSAASRRHVGPPYSRGPDVWQRHTTPWRLWYRNLAT